MAAYGYELVVDKVNLKQVEGTGVLVWGQDPYAMVVFTSTTIRPLRLDFIQRYSLGRLRRAAVPISLALWVGTHRALL